MKDGCKIRFQIMPNLSSLLNSESLYAFRKIERSKMNENILLLFSHFKSLPKLNINLGQFQKLRLQAFANCRVMKKIMGHQFQRRRTCNFSISIFFNDFFLHATQKKKRIFGMVKSKALLIETRFKIAQSWIISSSKKGN